MFVTPERNKHSNKSNILTIKEVLKMPTGKINGAIIAKVIKRPGKINTFLNIMVKDEEGTEIQCCFFSHEAEKYYPILEEKKWYRFENFMLQTNNFRKSH